MRKRIADVLAEVAAVNHITVEQLMRRPQGRSRGRGRFVRMRWEAMYRVFTECPHVPYTVMAKRMGFHHTSCLHGIRRYCEENGLSYDLLASRRVAQGAHPGSRLSIRQSIFAAYGQTMEQACAW